MLPSFYYSIFTINEPIVIGTWIKLWINVRWLTEVKTFMKRSYWITFSYILEYHIQTYLRHRQQWRWKHIHLLLHRIVFHIVLIQKIGLLIFMGTCNINGITVWQNMIYFCKNEVIHIIENLYLLDYFSLKHVWSQLW